MIKTAAEFVQFFPAFLGKRPLDREMNFFKAFKFVTYNFYLYRKGFYNTWNVVSFLGVLQLMETGCFLVAVCPHDFLVRLKKIINPVKICLVASNFFIRCGGFVSNFETLRWYAFFKKIKISQKRPQALFFLDGGVPSQLVIQCISARVFSVGFFVFKRLIHAYFSIVFMQPWVGRSLFMANYYLFYYFLQPFFFRQVWKF